MKLNYINQNHKFPIFHQSEIIIIYFFTNNAGEEMIPIFHDPENCILRMKTFTFYLLHIIIYLFIDIRFT